MKMEKEKLEELRLDLCKVLSTSTLEGLEKLLDKARWDADAFVHALWLGNAIISQNRDKDSYARYLLHQKFNRYFSEIRAEKLGEEAEVVFDFFFHGEAEQVSLFSGYPEIARDLFRSIGGDLPNNIIIGYGCQDISVFPVIARFNTWVDHDWGWEDHLGEHIEYYDAATRTFYRKSMSGRTCYRLLIDEDGYAIPQPYQPDSSRE